MKAKNETAAQLIEEQETLRERNRQLEDREARLELISRAAEQSTEGMASGEHGIRSRRLPLYETGGWAFHLFPLTCNPAAQPQDYKCSSFPFFILR